MNKSTLATERPCFSARAALVAIGVWLQQRHLFTPIKEGVHIPQKTVQHAPWQKLLDAFIALLAGAHGLIEINKRVRSDPALQRAFGRGACAEQSVVQQTLDACTSENVTQMQQACNQIFRQRSRSFRHRYAERLQELDADVTGNPCGKKCEFATKGYFARQPNRRGRQLGRV